MLQAVLLGIVWLVIVATAVPLLRHGAWWIRALEFPRAQITTLGLAAGAIAWGLLDRGETLIQISFALLAVSLGWQLIRIARYSPLVPKQLIRERKGLEGRESLRLVSCNVYQFNRRSEALLQVLREEKPDVILLLEADDWWAAELKPLHEEYPYRLDQAQDDTYGMLFLSRLKLKDAEIRFLRREHIPSVKGWLILPSGRRVRLYGLHPEPPYPEFADTSRQRDAELLTVAQEIREADDEPTVVLGDLNDVAWSRTTRLFQRISGLLDPRIGRYPMSTFPANLPFLRFPLDHVFVSKHFALSAFDRLPNVHSDHFPVLCEVRIDRLAEEEQEAPAPENGDELEVDEVLEEAEDELDAEDQER
jgi:endonuclease/exonuclease/phosphatase (EEP) superfamily protein YafD